MVERDGLLVSECPRPDLARRVPTSHRCSTRPDPRHEPERPDEGSSVPSGTSARRCSDVSSSHTMTTSPNSSRPSLEQICLGRRWLSHDETAAKDDERESCIDCMAPASFDLAEDAGARTTHPVWLPDWRTSSTRTARAACRWIRPRVVLERCRAATHVVLASTIAPRRPRCHLGISTREVLPVDLRQDRRPIGQACPTSTISRRSVTCGDMPSATASRKRVAVDLLELRQHRFDVVDGDLVGDRERVDGGRGLLGRRRGRRRRVGRRRRRRRRRRRPGGPAPAS